LGVAAAFVAAGEIYRDGAEGVPVDFAKAHLAFCKAATAGSAKRPPLQQQTDINLKCFAGDLHAYIHLARMYQHGQGNVACDKKAFSHTMSAAAFGLQILSFNTRLLVVLLGRFTPCATQHWHLPHERPGLS
jgi:TPR repeat protein